MMRVCPASQSDASESSSFLKVDPRKKQITIMEPAANQAPSSSSQKKSTANQVPPKMFTFDAAFPPDASQVNKKEDHILLKYSIILFYLIIMFNTLHAHHFSFNRHLGSAVGPNMSKPIYFV